MWRRARLSQACITVGRLSGSALHKCWALINTLLFNVYFHTTQPVSTGARTGPKEQAISWIEGDGPFIGQLSRRTLLVGQVESREPLVPHSEPHVDPLLVAGWECVSKERILLDGLVYQAFEKYGVINICKKNGIGCLLICVCWHSRSYRYARQR